MISHIFSGRIQKSAVSEVEYFLVRRDSSSPRYFCFRKVWSSLTSAEAPQPPRLAPQPQLKSLGERGCEAGCPHCQHVPVQLASGQDERFLGKTGVRENMGTVKQSPSQLPTLIPLDN